MTPGRWSLRRARLVVCPTRMQRTMIQVVSSQLVGKSEYFALTWAVSGEIILLIVVNQKIRADPLTFTPPSGYYKRHFPSSAGKIN
jgi:hypothetical protein